MWQDIFIIQETYDTPDTSRAYQETKIWERRKSFNIYTKVSIHTLNQSMIRKDRLR